MRKNPNKVGVQEDSPNHALHVLPTKCPKFIPYPPASCPFIFYFLSRNFDFPILFNSFYIIYMLFQYLMWSIKGGQKIARNILYIETSSAPLGSSPLVALLSGAASPRNALPISHRQPKRNSGIPDLPYSLLVTKQSDPRVPRFTPVTGQIDSWMIARNRAFSIGFFCFMKTSSLNMI